MERREQIKDVFRAALEAAGSERSAFLDEACGDDRSLRVIVQSMLNKHFAARLGDPVPEGQISTKTTPPQAAEEADPLIGTRIGDYRIKRHIGAGGMGSVYQAVQDKPRRVVAIKVMLKGIASHAAMRRLEFEAQLLGRLRHPGIAEVYQAGTWESEYGPVPYFAMEYIPNARTVTEFADRAHLGTRSRLELFEKVCAAVHHGHQKGIIHRDLKPSNILVDSSRQPKIIDFGVARSTDSDMAVTTLQTDVGQIIGTLQYMSPEQCEADPHDIDTRSDVYSLGVVLYELLCGQLPYNVSDVPIFEAARIVQEVSPARPSTLNRMLKGDLETITLKTLQKDRRHRYQSASEVAQDIGRYLRDEPIMARPPSARYQLKHFAKRHRGLFAAMAAIFVLMVLATAAGLFMAVDFYRQQAAQAEERAGRTTVDAAHQLADAQWKSYAYEILAASQAFDHQEIGAAEDHLKNAIGNFRGWEWRHLANRRADNPRAITLPDRALSVALNQDGSRMAVACEGGVVEIRGRQGESLKSVEHDAEVHVVDINANGTVFALGSVGVMEVRDAATADVFFADQLFNGPVRSVAFSGNGELVAGCSAQAVRIWRVAKGNVYKTLHMEHDVRSIRLDNDGRLLAVGFENGSVGVWKTKDGTYWLRRVHAGPVNAVAFAADAHLLSSASDDGTVRIWDVADQQLRDTLTGHGSAVYSVTFNEDASRLASGSDHGSIRIWDVEKGRCILSLSGHDDRVSSVSFSGDGKRLASASFDKSIRLWESR